MKHVKNKLMHDKNKNYYAYFVFTFMNLSNLLNYQKLIFLNNDFSNFK